MSKLWLRPCRRSGSARFSASSMVRPNTKLRPRIFIASRTAVRTTGSPSRPTARPSAAFQLSDRSFAPSSTLPVRSSEKVAALTKDESERAELLRPVGPRKLVGDQLVGGVRVGNPQQRLGEAHHRDALVGAEIVGVKEGVETGRLVRAHALARASRAVAVASPSSSCDSRACPMRSLGDLLFVGPVGAPQLGSVDRSPRSPARYAICPWQCLYFLPDPHGHGALRLIGASTTPPASRAAASAAAGC